MIKTHADGSKEYWENGRLHREGGPACDFVNGHKAWHKHGKLHNETGPAIVWPDGREYWFLDDVQYPEWLFPLALKFQFIRNIKQLRDGIINGWYKLTH